MKKAFTIVLSAVMLCFAGCSSGSKQTTSESSTLKSQSVSESSAESEEKSAAPSEASNDTSDDLNSVIADIIDSYNFEGVLYVKMGGKVITSFAGGSLENGDAYSVGTSIPVGSVSKQFCAAAILSLRDQGRLSLDDTLEKYFPEYTNGRSITLKNLLSMRSGIPNLPEELLNVVTVDKTEEENIASIKEAIFGMPLEFEPDSRFAYSNNNYFLLSNIIEQITGRKYIDFLRESFFVPLGMSHTGNIDEMRSGAEWANGVFYNEIDAQPGLTKGAGDIITNAEDITLWLNGLVNGKVISESSFKEMTTNYSSSNCYGYGLFTPYFAGIGHPGSIGKYTAADYIDTKNNITVFFAGGTLPAGSLNNFLSQILSALNNN